MITLHVAWLFPSSPSLGRVPWCPSPPHPQPIYLSFTKKPTHMRTWCTQTHTRTCAFSPRARDIYNGPEAPLTFSIPSSGMFLCVLTRLDKNKSELNIAWARYESVINETLHPGHQRVKVVVHSLKSKVENMFGKQVMLGMESFSFVFVRCYDCYFSLNLNVNVFSHIPIAFVSEVVVLPSPRLLIRFSLVLFSVLLQTFPNLFTAAVEFSLLIF